MRDRSLSRVLLKLEAGLTGLRLKRKQITSMVINVSDSHKTVSHHGSSCSRNKIKKDREKERDREAQTGSVKKQQHPSTNGPWDAGGSAGREVPCPCCSMRRTPQGL